MRKLAYIVFMAMMIALLASGCFKMAPTAQLETEEAIFILKNGSIEVKAAKELSGLEVFLKARVEESEVSAKGTCAIVKQFEDGTYIATAIGGKFKSGETVMTIRGGFTDLKKLSIETMGVELEEEYGPQSQVPKDGVYVQDTWVSSNVSGNKLAIGAKNLNIVDYSDTPINGFSFVVKYDPADIEITGVTNRVSGASISEIDYSSTGVINVYAGYPDKSGVFIVAPTELLEITFNSKDVKTVSQVTLENVQVTVFDSNSEWNPVYISAVGTGGFITIGDPKLLGDFNLDGIVGTADLGEFATYYRETYTVITDLLAYYDIGPAKKAYGGAWEDIYTEAKPDLDVDLLDLVIMAQNWAVPKPTDFNYVKTLDELNAAIASDSFTSIVFGSDISGTPNVVGRLVDINLNGYTLTGDLNFDMNESGTINLYAGEIEGDLTVNAPNATFNNYADVTGEVTINGVSAGTWNEYFCENNLVWNAENSTLYVYCGAEGITFNASASRVVFDGPAIVTGGHFIEYAIIAPGTNVTFDTPPQHVEILDGTIWNSRTGSFYSTIQAAIDEADSGDTIFVGAGTYAEQLVIEKPLTLEGPNAGTHGFSDNRVPEAKLVFPDDPVYFDSPLEDVITEWRVLVEIGSENVTVDGFSFSNEGLFSEIKYMGGVFSYKGSLKVTNNSFEGFTTAIKTDIPIDTVYIENVEISYNYVHDNVRWTNSSIYIQGAGADVFENVTKNVGNSIQIQPYSNSGTGSVHDNEFESWLLGIWHNYAMKGSGTWTITNNKLTAASYPTVVEPKNWRGIEVQTFGSSKSGDAPRVEFRDNTIDAAKIIDEYRFDTVIGIRMSSPVSDDAVAVFENNAFINVRTGALRLDGTLNLGTVLSSNTFPEGFAVNEVGDMIGKFKVTNTTKKKGYDTIQAAINAADAGDVIEVSEGAHTIDSQININKAITLRGVVTNEEWKTKLQVSGSGYRLSVSASATIENFEIEKTDKTGVQNIIGIFASEVSIKSNKIYGRYELGDGEVSRAMEISGGLTDVLIENNEIYSLRQPAYINPNTTGSIKDNHVYLTRGWVIDGALMTFNGNTWGTGDDANATDIALLIETTLGEPYDDLEALKSANNNASIEDQRVNPDSIYVNASSAKSEGSPTYPFKTIAEGLNAVNENGTIYVAEGTYNENVIINKQGIKLIGEGYEDPSCTKINGAIAVTEANVEISGFMISGGGVAYSNAKAGIYIVGGTTGHKINGNKLVGSGNDPADGPGILFGYNASNVEISSNVIISWYQGMYINPSSNIVIEENTLESNYVGIGSDGLNDVSIVRNQFKNNEVEDWGSSNVGVDVSAQYNTFIHGEGSNCMAVAHYSGNMINATCNWWGSIDPVVIAGKVRGLVNWSPFWTTAVGPCGGYAPVRNITTGLPYTTIQAAFDDLYALDKPAEPTPYTIEVKEGTYDEQLLITQQENKNIVLRAVDGDEVVLRRTVIINGKGRHDGEESLTISGFEFTYDDEGFEGGKDFIVTTDPSAVTNGYAHNVTIENCSFSGNPADLSFVAIRNPKAGYDFIISDCQGYYLHSLVQFASAVTGAKIDNCTLVDCKSGLNLNASTNVQVNKLWFEGPGYGIRAGQSTGTPADTTLNIANSVLIGTSVCTVDQLGDPDTALVLRGDAPKNVTISQSVIMNTNSESYAIANVNSLNAGSYSLTISGNYWGETDYSSGLLGELGSAQVTCENYYKTATYTTVPPVLSNLVNIP
ncbi:NosD domain-containing protein [Mesotoga sp. BH458_6_3_2_1]|uniref:NosD domain-containing protein n=1 Tax=Mesotoga sp. BH458_6_3_2_1 TaxID=1437446 RepID=UPI000EF27211|nr:NosD domain-containing protein [Mesotoga sp. BH458_6_3_2_1]RLL81718.1 hypothetical protein Y697_13410 [Mesotoga sp. BH458_6_3_2_1]